MRKIKNYPRSTAHTLFLVFSISTSSAQAQIVSEQRVFEAQKSVVVWIVAKTCHNQTK